MKLEFQTRHASINQLTCPELPSLTILTGVNGSGKTHLLEAIASGCVTVDCVGDIRSDILKYDWSNFVPNNSGSSNVQSIYAPRDEIINRLKKSKSEKQSRLNSIIQSHSINTSSVADVWDILTASEEELSRLTPSEISAQSAHKDLVNLAQNMNDEVVRVFHNKPQVLSLLKAIESQGKSIFEFSTTYFDENEFQWSRGNLFQQSFAELFLMYFALRNNNLIRQIKKEKNELLDIAPISDDEFLKKHGLPPWEFVNEVLRNAKLDFEIDEPRSLTETTYLPKLTKIATGQEILFEKLSSGEKVLMSFAFCLYHTNDKRHQIAKPKLLLFDEIDAPLHPSMSRNIMDTISKTIVAENNINVIFVTHSPSTVAVAPDEAIHVMEPNTGKIRNTTKRQAISVLTSEIPTLSISFEGRRQVFVESSLDAKRYDRLYQIVKQDLSSERSLTFIGAGVRKGIDEGCARVRELVDVIGDKGNNSVFGLIDWDLKNTSSNRIAVLADQRRYAIENCLLDPLIVLAVMMQLSRSSYADFGLPEYVTYVNLPKLEVSILQTAVDIVQVKVIGPMPANSSLIEVTYRSGTKLSVRSDYLKFKGHDLAGKLLQKFPCLKKFNNNQKDFLWYITDTILSDHPGLIPSEIEAAFIALCEQEPEH